MKILKDNIESKIIELLKNGPLPSIKLIEEIKKIRNQTTKEAVYKSLRKLHKEEVILKNKTMVSLNNTWLLDMTKFFEESCESYIEKPKFKKYSNGDSVQYNFKTLELLDVFWNHSILELTHVTNENDPIYVYCPHYWFPLVRFESESKVVKSVIERKHKWLLAVENNEPLDKLSKKILEDLGGQYAVIQKNKFNQGYYLNIFNDFILEVNIDPKVAVHIHNWYLKWNTINSESEKELNELLKQKGKYRLKITRNRQKALTLAKFLKKYFY